MAGTINETDMYNLLSQVFKPEVTNTLLKQLKGETTPVPIVDRVQPGDLITADLMNEILIAVQDLQTRLSRLEGAGVPAAGRVRIDRLIPSGALSVGDEVIIEGENFEFSLGGAGVYFNNESVSAIKPGSGDKRLVVDVPALSMDLPDTGSQVLLAVSNRNSSDYRSVTILPPKIILYGSVLVTPDSVEPDPPMAGKMALFGYKITSAASAKADFPIKVLLAETGKTLDSLQYDHLVTVLGPDKKTPVADRKISLEPGTPTFVYVKLAQLPFPDNSSFDIMVSLSTSEVNGDSMIKTYTVGQESNEDSYLALELINYDHADWVASGVATIPSTKNLQASMTLKLTEEAVKAGVLKADCDISIALTEGSGWTLLIMEPTPTDGIAKCTLTVGADGKTPVPVNLRYAMIAKPAPTASARFELTVKRQGQTGSEKIKKTGLALSTPIIP